MWTRLVVNMQFGKHNSRQRTVSSFDRGENIHPRLSTDMIWDSSKYRFSELSCNDSLPDFMSEIASLTLCNEENLKENLIFIINLEIYLLGLKLSRIPSSCDRFRVIIKRCFVYIKSNNQRSLDRWRNWAEELIKEDFREVKSLARHRLEAIPGILDDWIEFNDEKALHPYLKMNPSGFNNIFWKEKCNCWHVQHSNRFVHYKPNRWSCL